MKSIIRIISVLLLLTTSLPAFSKGSPDEVILTVTSDGATKDEAIKNALRTAIEQTYGVFISANTDILNDEVVADEIATISSGNIKRYSEIAVTNLNDKVYATLEVVVSKGKLLKYAKSKGSECELDGAALGYEIELNLLNKQNEEKAVENLVKNFQSQLANMFDYIIDVDHVKISGVEEGWGNYQGNFSGYELNTQYMGESIIIPIKVTLRLNEYGVNTLNQMYDQLKSISLYSGYLDLGGHNYVTLPNEVRKNSNGTAFFPFITKNLGHDMLKFYFRSSKSGDLISHLFGSYSGEIDGVHDFSIYSGEDKLITASGEDSYRDMGRSKTHHFNPNLSIKKNLEYMYSIFFFNTDVNNIKKIKNLKVISNYSANESD